MLVYIELDDGRPTQASLGALTEGRRIASAFGATLYALVPSPEVPSYGEDDVLVVLGRQGADKILLFTAPGLDRPTLFSTHGLACLAACAQFPPALFLFPDTAGGRDIAPRVAARLAAAFANRSQIELRGEAMVLSRVVHGGLRERRLVIEDIERPVVVTFAGRPGEPTGDGDAEVVMLTAPTRIQPEVEEVLEEKPSEPIARVLLLIDGKAPEEPLRKRLLELGIEVAPAEEAAALPLPAGGLIIAIGADPSSLMFARSRLGIVGEPTAVLEELASALATGAP